VPRVWIKQGEFGSDRPRTRERVAYLTMDASVSDTVERAIRDYFEREPAGEQVTLNCLAALGQARVEATARNWHKSPDTVKQDLGLLVPIRLCQLAGTENVETLRDESTRRNATRQRSSRWPMLTWVSKYTPHRVNKTGLARLRGDLHE